MGLNGAVGANGSEIDAGFVGLLAGITEAVEFHLNCCWYYCLALKPNVVDQRVKV